MKTILLCQSYWYEEYYFIRHKNYKIFDKIHPRIHLPEATKLSTGGCTFLQYQYFKATGGICKMPCSFVVNVSANGRQ